MFVNNIQFYKNYSYQIKIIITGIKYTKRLHYANYILITKQIVEFIKNTMLKVNL